MKEGLFAHCPLSSSTGWLRRCLRMRSLPCGKVHGGGYKPGRYGPGGCPTFLTGEMQGTVTKWLGTDTAVGSFLCFIALLWAGWRINMQGF